MYPTVSVSVPFVVIFIMVTFYKNMKITFLNI